MYKVTVITSIFRGKEYLPSFLENVLEQTAFEECEWYLLDAASPDDEFSVIEPYLTHKNIRYERLDLDPGIYACWNYMINNSDSEYITNANIDDRLFPNSIEKHIKELDKNPDYDLAYSENIMTYEPNALYQYYLDGNPFILYPGGPFNRQDMLIRNYPHSHPMWRRSLHDRFGTFEEKYRSAGDYEFWLRCLHGGVKDFLYMNDILGIYYHNPVGISTKESLRASTQKEEQEIKSKYVSLGI